MELQRYGILLVLCVSFLFTACDQPKSGETAAQNTYDWNRGQDADEGGPECTATNRRNRPIGIIGGEDVGQANWLAKGIVFLMQTYRDADGREMNSICTASLVDTNIVLTAAHCVDKARSSSGAKLGVYFTTQPECENAQGTLPRKRKIVTAIQIHPNWNPEDTRLTDRGDIALVRFAGRAPAGYKPLKLSSSFVPMSEHSPILVAGYGMVNPNYYGDFGGPIALRVTQAPGISDSERQALLSLSQSSFGDEHSQAEFNNSATNEMLYIDQSKGHGICGGDSGGPSLMKNEKGEDVVTGVASFVMNPDDPSKLCGYVAAHTSVVYHKNWIIKAFQELRNGDSALPTPFP